MLPTAIPGLSGQGRINRQRRSFFCVIRLQCPVGLLILSLPGIIPPAGLGGLRPEQPGQEQQGQDEQQASPESKQRQGQQQQHEPGAGIFPTFPQRAFTTHKFTAILFQPQGSSHGACAQLHVPAATCVCYGLQACAVQPGDHHVAGTITDETSTTGNRSSVNGAHGKYRCDDAMFLQFPGPGGIGGICRVRNQQNFTVAETGAAQQGCGHFQGPVRPAAGNRNDIGLQGRQQVGNGIHITGQR